LLIVCYSLLILLGVLVLRDGLEWRKGLAIGLVFAVGTLTKPTLNGIAPLIGLLVVYDWWARGRDGRGNRREWAIGTAAMVGVALLPLAWWMARSWRLNGDLLYFNPVIKGHRIIQNPYFNYAFLQHMLDYYQSVWGGIFVTWWAHFGWLDTALPPWVYTLLRMLVIASIGGLALTWLRRRGTMPSPGQWRGGDGPAPLIVWFFLALTIVLPILLLQVYDLSFWREYGIGRGLQGRYWLGTVVPMLTFFAAGLLAWLPMRLRPMGHMALRTGMVLFNIVCLTAFILPRYYL
jgi:hypothetical protein